MKPIPFSSRGGLLPRSVVAAVAALALGGCAGTAIEQNFDHAQKLTQERLGTELKWLRTDEARREAREQLDATLGKPLSADDAVRLALAHSPAVQALLYESAAASAAVTQSARLPNPVFAFDRLARTEDGVRELEIGRLLSFSVFDLLLLPARLRRADHRQRQTSLRLASDVVQAASVARDNWVRAVAAQQSVQYFERVLAAADAGAELARRMQAVGNFSRLQRAREQAFSADAVTQLARARQSAQRAREALVRSLGLDAAQARRLTLPDRLPDLPAAIRDEQGIAQTGLDQRLDVRLTRANLDFAAADLGLTRVTSFVNGLRIAGVSVGETGREPQRGFDLSLPLPLFDFGDAGRSGVQAAYMAALHRAAQVGVSAASQLRESYGAYRTAFEAARHWRDEIVPLRKAIAEENLLRYNGMLIGVFELLADAREQIASVVQAIDAERDFWLADAALQTALIGTPMAAMPLPALSAGAPAAGGAGH
jgi:outer membrane protein TolC